MIYGSGLTYYTWTSDQLSQYGIKVLPATTRDASFHILRWYESEKRRRRINKQLNKGEAVHSLREYIHHANKGRIRRKYYDEQQNQAACLNLVTNIVITWYTVYIAYAIEQLKAEGHPVNDEDVSYQWPTKFAGINVHGKISFNIEEELNRKGLRPLRKPDGK
jgi:TnpA family transposase